MKKQNLAMLLALSLGASLWANAETAVQNPAETVPVEQAAAPQAEVPVAPKTEMPVEPKNTAHKAHKEKKAKQQHCAMHEKMHGKMHEKMPMDQIHAQFRQVPYQQGEMMNFHQWHPRVNGFNQLALTQVADAEKWQDDQRIVLEGNIIKQVGKKDYIFKDTSGELTIEISRKAWRGMINAEDKVKIVAEVEKSFGKTELEALSVQKVMPKSE